MHDWASNLANWFPWLPDGPVIFAWKLILEYSKIEDEIEDHYISGRIRESLLQAVARGMPVFTVGLRLLYEGLTMCSYKYKEEDEVVEEALKAVRVFLSNTDTSKETTTYLGHYPDLPNKEPFGKFQFPSIFSEPGLKNDKNRNEFYVPQIFNQLS